MIFNAKSEPAVSPVIGTILLVAIAVVLVAIILVVVMGFSGDTNEKKVGLNAKAENGANATLILYGGASIDELVKLEMIDQGSSNGSYVKLWDTDDGEAFVGVPYLAIGVAQPEKDMDVYDTRINVRGTFSDGSEVILLVQPMTFFDVAGSGNSDTSSQNPGLTVEAPVASDLKYRSATITFAYTNATSTPTSGKIYYKPVNDTSDGEPFSVNLIGTADGTGTRTFTGLSQGMEYEVWGVVTTLEDGTVKGNSSTFVADPVNVSAPTFSGIYATQFVVSFTYSNTQSTPEKGIIYYQSKKSGEIFNVTAIRTGTKFTSTLTNLPQGTEYYVWGAVVMSGGGVSNGPKGECPTKTTVVNAPTKNVNADIAGGVTVTFKVDYPEPSITDDVKVWYLPNDGGDPVSVSTYVHITGGSSYTYYRADLTGLEPGTYTVWGEVPISNGNTILEGASASIINLANNVKVPSVNSISAGSADVYFSVDYPDPSLSNIRLRYQADGGAEEYAAVSVSSSQEKYTQYYVKLTNLEVGKIYTVQGVITLPNGKTLIGPSKEFTAR